MKTIKIIHCHQVLAMIRCAIGGMVLFFASSASAQQVLATNIGIISPGGEPRQIECYLLSTGPLRYPPKAKRYRYVGQVIVKFGINSDGKVINPFVAESEPPGVFERAALMHIKSWRYQAPTYQGRPIAVDEVAVRLVFDPQRR